MLIPYARQSLDEDDIAAVSEVLRGPQIARGPMVTAFEHALGAVVGAPHVVACSSGTAGLHLACLAAGIGPGDEVIVPAITFAASANCAVYCGATPVFADVDRETICVDPIDVARKVTARTRAIVPVHFAGQACDLAALQAIARDAERHVGHKVWIIEDACHVLGSTYRGEPIGSCRWSDTAVFSFHPAKHITTGEGGAITTRDAELARTLEQLRGHGITKAPSEFHHAGDGPWYHEQQLLGYNYFLTDIQAALGISQLKRLQRFAVRRRAIVARYQDAFANLPHVMRPVEREHGATNFHLYVLQIDFGALGTTRAAFVADLAARGVGAQVHYLPVYRHPYHERWGANPADFPNTERYYERCLTIPLFPAMTDDEVSRVIESVTTTVRTYAFAHA